MVLISLEASVSFTQRMKKYDYSRSYFDLSPFLTYGQCGLYIFSI